MEQKRKLRLKHIIGISVLAAAVLAAIVLFTLLHNRGGGFADVSLFYFNNEWILEPVRVNVYANTQEELAEYALARLARLPEQFPGARTFPRGLDIYSQIEGALSVVTFCEQFDYLTSSARSITIASIVYTLTEFDFIENVSFVSGDTSLGPFDRKNLLLDDGLLPEAGGTRVYTLFYIHPTLPELVPVLREITLQTNRTVETLLIEELIAPSEYLDFRRVIPAGVRLRNNATTESRICYIDFSSDFLAQIDNEETIFLILNKIVYTITENTNATQVRLLFAGDRSSVVLEMLDLGMPLSRAHFEDDEDDNYL